MYQVPATNLDASVGALSLAEPSCRAFLILRMCALVHWLNDIPLLALCSSSGTLKEMMLMAVCLSLGQSALEPSIAPC